MPEPILVVGGAGYIGSHACKALAQAGYLPIVYDNLSTGHGYAVKWGPFIEGNLSDSALLDKTFQDYQPKAVLHFAAFALVSESMADPGKYYQNNVANTVNLLEAMRRASVATLIFSSTCAIYGIPKFLPLTEEHPPDPINPYGKSKWMIEQILDDYETAYGIRSAKLRYFNAAGADLDLQAGEDHAPETHLIPSIIQAVLKVRETIDVFGTDFPTKDGSAVRDYVHVQDLAAAHVLALQYVLQNRKSLSLNLGSGKGYSVLEVVDAVQQFSGLPLPVRLQPRRAGDPPMLIASFDKAQEILGWKPMHSDLSCLIESAWKWHKVLIESKPVLQSTLQRLDAKHT